MERQVTLGMDSQALIEDVFAQVGLTVRFPNDGTGRGVDVVVDPDDLSVELEVKRRALVTDDDAARLVAEALGLPDQKALLVVADRVTR